MTPIVSMTIVFLLALLIEALVEYFIGTPMNAVPKLKPWKFVLMYISAGFGIVAAFVYRLDMVSLLGTYVGASIAVTWFGLVLTGLAIGRGANFIHGIVQKFMKPIFPNTK